MWILGSPRKEISFLYLPGLLAIVIACLYPHLSETSLIYAVFTTVIIDSCHVYTTAWRTLLNPAERASSKKYWIAPLLIFIAFTTWYFTAAPGLWSFVVYATLYHHIRQVYGFSKWYQVLNGRSDIISDRFLYALALLPLTIYHFRMGVPAGYYFGADLFMFPDANIVNALTTIYIFVVGGWVYYEFLLWKKGIKELNRIVSVGYPTLIYGWCFLYGSTITQVLFPLLFIHGIAYFAVVGESLVRTQKERFNTFIKAIVVVVVTGIVLAFGESWVEEYALTYNIPTEWSASGFVRASIVGLYLTPLFCHYLFDSWIWRKNHREAHAVFAK